MNLTRTNRSEAAKSEIVYGVSHYFRWIRWCKEQIALHANLLPQHVLPGGTHYPVYYREFQNHLLELILQDYTSEELARYGVTEHAVSYLRQHRKDDEILYVLLRDIPEAFDLIPSTWERHANTNLLQYTYVCCA